MIVYNKLVRDRIPEIIEANGETCETRVLEPDEYVEYLNQKLGEELLEYQESHDIAELVDLVEIIYAIAASHGVGRDAFDQLRERKRCERGAFDRKLLLVSVNN